MCPCICFILHFAKLKIIYIVEQSICILQKTTCTGKKKHWRINFSPKLPASCKSKGYTQFFVALIRKLMLYKVNYRPTLCKSLWVMHQKKKNYTFNATIFNCRVKDCITLLQLICEALLLVGSIKNIWTWPNHIDFFFFLHKKSTVFHVWILRINSLKNIKQICSAKEQMKQ